MNIIHDILRDAIKHKASDIHLTNNIHPVLRIDGELILLEEYSVMTKEVLEEQIKYLLNQTLLTRYKENKFIDSSISFEGYRFRIHIFRQRECDAFSLRLIPLEIPEFKTLNLPNSIRKFTLLKNGLVLVTGTTGSGKSTTLASIIDEINQTQGKHIVTIEDPIEFIHTHKRSMINQREVGEDVHSFSDAVKGAMREDPDILMLGEMRDLDTIMNAITMAETGHLVFATLHTKSVAETVDRVIDVFPARQQKQVRVQLANSLQGIISQSLLPKKDGGRVPCCEIAIINDAIRSMIKEQSSPNAINDQMQINNKKNGSQTFCQALAELYKKGFITSETALANTEETENLKRMMLS